MLFGTAFARKSSLLLTVTVSETQRTSESQEGDSVAETLRFKMPKEEDLRLDKKL